MRTNDKRSLLLLRLVVTTAVWFLLVGPADAGLWTGVEKALQEWKGSPDVTLRSDLEDPLGSPAIQSLLEQLLARGIHPTLAEADAAVAKGLVLDLRQSSGGLVAVLSDAETGRILALDRPAATPVPEPVIHPPPPSVTKPAETATEPPVPAVKPSAPEKSATPMNLSAHPLELSWPAKRLALVDATPGQGPVVALLTDKALQLVRLEDGTAKPLDSWVLGIPSARALYVGFGDVNDDGRGEIVAVWVEDLRGIYQGTESQPHAWVFAQSEGTLTLLSRDFEAFIRVADGRLLLQKRGPFTAFAGPVLPVEWDGGKFRVGTEPVWPEGRSLYAVTPLPQENQALFWTDDNRLLLGSIEAGGTKELVADLGTVAHPAVAAPLRETEYRAGLAREDRINERYYSLPRRIAVAEDGAVLTFVRGRSEGLPLVGSLSGQDRVAKIAVAPEGLTLENPYPGVEAFMLDVAPLPDSGNTKVLVLLNDRPDGTGKARLLIQSPR